MIIGETMSANLKADTLGFHFSHPYAGKLNKMAFNQKTLIPQSIKNTKAKYSKLNLGDLQVTKKTGKESVLSLRPKENGKISLEKSTNL